MTSPLDWREMRERSADLLRRRTGEDMETWNARVREAPGDEARVRAWLTERDITGYAQMRLVWERFGYPDFMTARARPDHPIGVAFPGRCERSPWSCR